MNENEKRCDYKIVAFVNGKKQEIPCGPSKAGCLRDLVWCGIGVERAAAFMLGRSAKGIEACASGECVCQNSSRSLQLHG